MATYIATVATGLEREATREIEEFGIAVAETSPGALFFDGPEFPSEAAVELLRELNAWSRGIDRFGIVVATGQVAGPAGCYEHAREVDYASLLHPQLTFAVRCRRSGDHDFGSMDVARSVGQAVIEAFRDATGKRLVVSLGDPDAIFRADLHDSAFRLWLDATGARPLYLRSYRKQLHPASMRASMAHLLLRVANWRGEPLLDPMTGIGTVPIEAGLYAHGVAPAAVRSEACAIDRISARFGCGDAVQRRWTAPSLLAVGPLLGSDSTLDVLGVERYDGHVQGAWLNLAAAGSPAGVRIEKGDARRLDRYVDEDRYRLAVVNPPFGRRVGSTAIVAELYQGFTKSAADRGIDRIVALVENHRLMSAAMEGAAYEVVRSTAVLYGDLPARIVVAERRR